MYGFYLVMVNVTHIPHLVIAVDGKTYSLSVKGAAVDGDLRSLLRTIDLRSIKSVFVKLSFPSSFDTTRIASEARKHVLSYSSLEGGITCLAPVKDVCSTVYEIDPGNVNFIYELLPLLHDGKAVEEYFHLNLDACMVDGAFSFRKYSMNDIQNEIRKAAGEIKADKITERNF